MRRKRELRNHDIQCAKSSVRPAIAFWTPLLWTISTDLNREANHSWRLSVTGKAENTLSYRRVSKQVSGFQSNLFMVTLFPERYTVCQLKVKPYAQRRRTVCSTHNGSLFPLKERSGRSTTSETFGEGKGLGFRAQESLHNSYSSLLQIRTSISGHWDDAPISFPAVGIILQPVDSLQRTRCGRRTTGDPRSASPNSVFAPKHHNVWVIDLEIDLAGIQTLQQILVV